MSKFWITEVSSPSTEREGINRAAEQKRLGHWEKQASTSRESCTENDIDKTIVKSKIISEIMQNIINPKEIFRERCKLIKAMAASDCVNKDFIDKMHEISINSKDDNDVRCAAIEAVAPLNYENRNYFIRKMHDIAFNSKNNLDVRCKAIKSVAPLNYENKVFYDEMCKIAFYPEKFFNLEDASDYKKFLSISTKISFLRIESIKAVALSKYAKYDFINKMHDIAFSSNEDPAVCCEAIKLIITSNQTNKDFFKKLAKITFDAKESFLLRIESLKAL